MTEVQIRHEGMHVPDGLSITVPQGGRLHITYQVRVNSQVIRCRFAIPQEWETLTIVDIISQGNWETEIFQEEKL